MRPSVSETSLTKSSLGKFIGTVGQSNRSDDYSFTVSRRGRFSASLTGLQANAALQLLSKGERILAQSDREGQRSELIQKTLRPGTYVIRVLQRAGRTNYTLSVTDNLRPSTLPINPIPSINLLQNLSGEYRGTSVTTTGLINPASGQFTDGPKSFQTNITARIRAPIAVGSAVESNPFNLSISSSVADLSNAALGAIALYSALPNSQNALGQSWSFQYKGDRVSGTLTNPNNISRPSAPNYFFADSFIFGVRSFLASDMNASTTLQGTLTANELRLRLQGSSGNLRTFMIDIAAQRI